jgi:hypothetical protein
MLLCVNSKKNSFYYLSQFQGKEFLWITGGDDSKTTELISSNGNVRAEKDLPETRRDHCMLVIGNHVMIIGGVTPAGTTNSVLVYDSQNRFSLKRGPSMMKARAFFACSTMVSPAHGGRTVAVVAGGYGSPDTAEILDYTKPGSSWQLS